MNIIRVTRLPQIRGVGANTTSPAPALSTSPPNTTADPAQDAFENLMPALIQCFGIIFIGYFAGRINLLTQGQGRGIGTFVGSFAMPAMLFKSMVELHFSDVDWYFLLAIFIAKSVVFLATALLTLVLIRPVHTGKMGIYSIFTTQSHDFALGIPIVQALYSQSHPEYEKYLYLIAPISVAFLNPIGFLLLEVERWRHQARSGSSRSHCVSLLHVLGRVFTNPIVFMTLLGIAGNFLLSQRIPYILDSLLTVLKDAFPATALFCLGLSMVGRISSQGRTSNYITPALLIAAKMLVSPFLVRELVSVFPGQGNRSTADSLSTYGFLYGAFPTAPSVFIYASQYETQAEMMATGMVVSTFLSAPLMFISARMITLSSATRATFESLLTTTSFDVGIIGLVACVWVLVVFIIHRRVGTLPHKFSTGLLFSQMLVCVGVILWRSLDMSVAWQHYLHFILFFVGVLGSRFWMAGIALTMCLLRMYSLCFVLRIHGWIALACVLLPILLSGILIMSVGRDLSAQSPAFEYGMAQQILVVVCLSLLCIVTMVSLVLQHRWTPTCPKELTNGDCPQTDSTDSTEEVESPSESAPMILAPVEPAAPRRVTAAGRSRRVRVPSGRPAKSDASCGTCNDCGSCSTSAPTRPVVRNIEDIVPDVTVRPGRSSRRRVDSQTSDTDTSCTFDRTCSVEQRTRCLALLQGYNSFKLQLEEQDDEQLALLQERDEYQMARHVVLVLLLLMSSLVGLFLNMWRLMNETKTGVYIEIEFLDSVLVYGQSIFTFTVFGLDSQMVIEPLVNRLKHWLARRWPSLADRWRRPKVHLRALDDLPAAARTTCGKFLNYHQQRCVRDIVRDRTRGTHQYKSVFTGRNLIDWLLEVGLSADRGEGLHYGRQLLSGGVVEHVTREHHFFDLPYFYRFTDTPPEAARTSNGVISGGLLHV